MTKSVKVITRWDRFKRMTVWHPLHTDPADEDRWGPRFWFPTYDVWALALGLYAIYLGSPLLNRLFPEWVTDTMGIFLVVASLVCLVGVCFPKLNYLELIGKLLIVFILGAYAGTVMFRASTDGPNGFVVIVLIMSKLFVQVPKNPSVVPALMWITKQLDKIPRLKRKRQ